MRAAEAAAARRAHPLLHANGDRLTQPHDIYQLTVEFDRYGVAEYFADEVRGALLLDGVSPDPVDGYLLPGPSVPLSASAWDGHSGPVRGLRGRNGLKPARRSGPEACAEKRASGLRGGAA